jgi:putative tryptophan/tyrosine transport system substrate-binding protein
MQSKDAAVRPQRVKPNMRRREFITLLGGALPAWACAARAQEPRKVVRIGLLGPLSASAQASRVEAIRQGLRDHGYIEGTNLTIEYRWAEGRYERLLELAGELVRANVDVIITYGTPASLAAKQATTTIPIVVALIGDPIVSGLVTSVSRLSGNVTGQSFFNPQLRAKRVELLKEVKPGIARMAVLLNPDNPASVPEFEAMEVTARSLGVSLQPFRLRGPSEFVSAFESIEQAGAEAVETGDDGMVAGNLGAIAALAARARLLSTGPKEVAQAGGLMGYGVDIFATYRRAGIFVDKILKGARPADLPIEQATKFATVLNLRTARALGLDVPTATLLRADEVIE